MMKLTMRSLHFLFLFLISYFLFLISPSRINAASLEQYISITNQEFSTTATNQPTDNSLGIIHWQSTAYSHAAVYFEAVIRCDACSGGNAQATAALYDTQGNPVTTAQVSTTNDNYALVRTDNPIISYLSDNTTYTVRLSRDANTGTAYLISARLVIIQSHSQALTATQSQLEIGSFSTTSNTAYTLPGYPKIIRFESSRYAPIPTITFAASLKSSDPSTTASAALSASPTCASTVSGSEVTVTGDTWQLAQSNSFSLSTGTYYACFKSSEATASASIANAKLILSQSSSAGISLTRTLLPFHTTPLATNTNTYTNQGAILQFTRTNFSGADFDFYYQSNLTTNGGTAYSHIDNTTDSAPISNSEITTTSTAITRLTTTDITNNLPGSAKILNSQIKNSDTNTTSQSGSWLIADMTMYPNLSFSIQAVPASTTTNGVTTSVASTTNTLNFGVLPVGSPVYIAHQLTAATNAANGYTVYAKMIATLQGDYPANVINDFPATWNSPTTWSSPTGTTPNVNTGWFGANTSDTRVPGWSNGSGLFGPIGTTNQIIMRSPGIDSGTTAYITYAIEVNLRQPTDTYTGLLQYTILPIY